MSLYDDVNDLREQVANKDKLEVETPVKQPVHVEETDEEEDTPPETTTETETEAPEEVPEKLDNQAFARLRAEKKTLERQLEAARRSSQGLPAQQQPVKADPATEAKADPEPNKQENYESWLEWQIRQQNKTLNEVKEWKETNTRQAQQQQTYKEAIEELGKLAVEFAADKPNYNQVAEFFQQKIKDGLSVLYPSATPQQIAQATAQQIMSLAGQYARQGLNPVEEMYDLAVNKYGYQDPDPELETQTDTKPKIDLNKVEQSKKRSATSLKAGGRNGSLALSLDNVGEMSIADFSKLTPEQRAELKRLARPQ